MAADAAAHRVIHYEEIRRHLSLTLRTFMEGSSQRSPHGVEQRSIAYQGVPVGTIKRFITGKGNADKRAVIEAVRARGFHPADDNEAAQCHPALGHRTHGGVR